MSNDLPGYLVIGHVAKDIVPNGTILGGTCSYAALTAHKLGQRTVAVTSYGPDIPSMAALDGIEIENVSHRHSTTFQNIYTGGRRRQIWPATASSLSLENVPPAWRKASIVHLAPLAQEMSPALCGDFPGSLIGVTIQGWLRGQDAEWNVIYRPHPELEAWLSRIDVLVLSLADLMGDRDAMVHLLTSVKLGVETVGPEGCKVYHAGQVTHIPVAPEVEIDPTGAGDIFAAAFFVRYRETRDFIKAAQFANACASLSVRGIGLEGIPSLAEVEVHLKELYGD
jgi:sugar/nucleoside kinase (ribokinase family)